jgi:IMP cyclohydrolase
MNSTPTLDRMRRLAVVNRANLAQLRYPGRLIGVGRTPDGNYFVLNAITVRSPKNQNRRFESSDNDSVVTVFADKSQAPTDPAEVANLLYTAIEHDRLNCMYVVGNGTQVTAAIREIDDLNCYLSLAEALGDQKFENDSLGTPRITAMLNFNAQGTEHPVISLSIQAKSEHPTEDGAEPGVREAHYVETSLTPGYGLFLHTYMDEKGEVISFSGDPLLLPIEGSTAEEVGNEFWVNLDEQYRVAIVVRVFARDFVQSGKFDPYVFNRFESVGG